MVVFCHLRRLRALRVWSVLVSSVLASSGCTTVAGIHDPIDKGAGTSGTAPTPAGNPFIGTWTTKSATARLTGCKAATSLTDVATLILTSGAAPNTVVVNLANTDCSVVTNI